MRRRGDVISKIVTNSGAHNTIYGPDGTRGLPRRTAGARSSRSLIRARTRSSRRWDRSATSSVRSRSIARADALLRQRQRSARVRNRRHQDRQDAAPRRGHRIRKGTGQAARMPEPRCRPHARRERAVALRRPQRTRAHLRCDRDAAQASRVNQASRSAWLGHVQHGWTLRVSVNRRSDRYENASDRRRAHRRDSSVSCRAKRSSRWSSTAARSSERAISSGLAGREGKHAPSEARSLQTLSALNKLSPLQRFADSSACEHDAT